MRSMRFPALLVSALLILVFATVTLRSEGVGKRAQKESGRVDRTQANSEASPAAAKVAPGARSRESNLSTIGAAPSQNVQLQTSLAWTFGGKGQRGWGLYAPLIAQLIDCEPGVEPSEFAVRVSRWQGQQGLEPNGVVDANTWSQMVTTFQSRRMKARPYPAASELVTIPISDCYDPERPEELRKADRETFAAYKRMVAGAAADPSVALELTSDGQLSSSERFLKIISAFRSREYQDQLRKQSPASGRAGLAINSPHFTGRALDLYVGGEPVSTKDENRSIQTQTRVYRWLVKNASRFGFQPYFFEPWHWEYVGTPVEATRRPGDSAR